jgi:hypothetical protein
MQKIARNRKWHEELASMLNNQKDLIKPQCPNLIWELCKKAGAGNPENGEENWVGRSNVLCGALGAVIIPYSISAACGLRLPSPPSAAPLFRSIRTVDPLSVPEASRQ